MGDEKCMRGLIPALFYISFGLGAVAVKAAEWRVTESVSVTERYSDNIDLEEFDEESELVSSISPSISIIGTGARAQVSANATMELNDSDGGSDAFNPRVSANGNIELLSDRLFVDANARTYQEVTDPFSASARDNLNRSDNSGTVISYGLSPYLVGRIKDYATTQLRYTFDQQLSSEDDFGDSDEGRLTLSVNSGPRYSIFTWNFNSSYRKTDNEVGNDDELLSTNLGVGYSLSRKWQLRGSIGRDWNDFESTRSDNDGMRWDFGVVWTPNSRVSVNLGYGERFFGDFPTVDVTYRHKRSVFTASYTKELTDSRSLRQRESLFNTTDAFGNPINPITGDPVPVSSLLVLPSNTQLVDERLSVSWAWQGKRTTVSLGLDYSTQESQNSVGDAEFSDVYLSFSRSLSSLLSLNGSISVDQQEDEQGVEAETRRYRVGLSRPVGTKSRVGLNYAFSERDSDRIDDDYRENRIDLSYQISF